MKKIITACVTLLFFLLSFLDATGQQISVHGRVIDTSGSPIGGASVKLSSKIGTLTNVKGEFSLSGPSAKQTIEVSYVGYQISVIHFNPAVDTPLIVVLKTEKNSLNDVVVIGVQQQSQRTTVAAISGITSKDIEDKPVASVDQLLQGRVAGVNVQVTSGAPGVAPTVVVRGNSTINTGIGNSLQAAQSQALSGPLYVIDGIPIDPADISNTSDATGTNFLAGININDIQNVQVQKDAVATAAWGSRGANGVIYITTKKGSSSVPVFEVNGYWGVEQRPQLLPTLTGSAERNQKVQLFTQYATSPEQLAMIPQILSDSMNPSYNNATDWQDLFYHNGQIRNADASMSGANDMMNYRLSMNYYDEDGIIRATGYQRYSLRGNFGFKINSKLSSQLIIGMVKEARQAGEQFDNGQQNTPFDGTSQPSSFYYVNGYDSANYLNLSNSIRNSNNSDNYSASLNTTYHIIPSLTYTLQGSVNTYLQYKDYFQPSNAAAIADALGDSPDQDPFATSANKAISIKSDYTTYMVANNLNFNKSFKTKKGNEHGLNVTVSQQYTSNVTNTTIVGATGLPSDIISTVTNVPPANFLTNSDNITSGSDYQKDALVSIIGQMQYDYNKRYLLYGSVRADASSRFGANNKWGTFPSIGAGWIISDEKFMKGVSNVVNFMKIRFSYGLSGQLPIGGFYAPYNTYTYQSTYNGNATAQPSYSNGLTKNNLSWGKTDQKDLGLEINLFKNRIMLVADVYEKVNKNQQFTLPLPFFTGYSNIFFNASDLWINNRGVDITLNTNNLSPQSKVQWHSTLVLSYNKNIIAKLPNGNRTFTTDDYYGAERIFQVGMPIYEFYQVKYMGVVNNMNQVPFNKQTGKYLTYFYGNHQVQPGDPLWYDPSGLGDVWSGEGNVPTGNPNPLFTGGFTNDITYKNFSLTISSVFTWKRTVFNGFEEGQFSNAWYNGQNGIATSRLPDLSKINYWTPEKAEDPNYKADFPSLNPWGGYFYQFFPFTSLFNVDGSYFKIKFITLNYSLPSKISDRLKLKRISVYANMSNVLTLKNKNNTMPDPEAVDQTGVYSGTLYPQAKVYTLGLDVRF